jgi:hypothetical protein
MGGNVFPRALMSSEADAAVFLLRDHVEVARSDDCTTGADGLARNAFAHGQFRFGRQARCKHAGEDRGHVLGDEYGNRQGHGQRRKDSREGIGSPGGDTDHDDLGGAEETWEGNRGSQARSWVSREDAMWSRQATQGPDFLE